MPARLRQRSPASKGPETVRITHPERIVYPDDGITKRDLAAYYVDVAKWMLPNVVGRPLVLVRCPDGVGGDCFFQKHPPPGLPSAVERVAIREKSKVNTYAMIRDLAGLLSLVQFGTMEIHAWGARADDIEHPDRLIFDLDPDAAVPWKKVVEAARSLRELLAGQKLESFVKTSGGKGLHVVVPLTRRHGWADIVSYSRAIADQMVAQEPERFVATMSKAARRGKIFIDYLRNERGSSTVANYSTRARPRRAGGDADWLGRAAENKSSASIYAGKFARATA